MDKQELLEVLQDLRSQREFYGEVDMENLLEVLAELVMRLPEDE